MTLHEAIWQELQDLHGASNELYVAGVVDHQYSGWHRRWYLML